MLLLNMLKATTHKLACIQIKFNPLFILISFLKSVAKKEKKRRTKTQQYSHEKCLVMKKKTYVQICTTNLKNIPCHTFTIEVSVLPYPQ